MNKMLYFSYLQDLGKEGGRIDHYIGGECWEDYQS